MENRPKERHTCSILRFVWKACEEEKKWIWSLEGVEGLAARSGGYSLLAHLLPLFVCSVFHWSKQALMLYPWLSVPDTPIKITSNCVLQLHMDFVRA
jgi:hypothetical protein